MSVYIKPLQISLFVIWFYFAGCISSDTFCYYRPLVTKTNTLPMVQVNVRSMTLLRAVSVCSEWKCPFVCTHNNSYYVPNFALATLPVPIDGTMTCWISWKGN